MSENNTLTATTCAGKFKVLFGTSHASKALGIIVKSHDCREEMDSDTVNDENGNVCFRQFRNRRFTGSITGTAILGDAPADKYTAARAALVVGATFTLPKNRGITRKLDGLLPIITDIQETTSAEGAAEMSISYEVHPNLTQFLGSDNMAGEEEADAASA